MTESAILFDVYPGKGGDLGIITLNRPRSLNSLNHQMISSLHKQLAEWFHADAIKAVIIRASEGRAFCAGGDLRHTYERLEKNDTSLAKFFYEEYQLNRFIFHYPKPYIAFLDGITMGGGVGISIHGSHRIATENILFAMPETGIGFFPDIGGTYFLPRLTNHIGFYLGLTGTKLGVDDCVRLGIATNKVPHHQLSDLLNALAETEFTNDANTAVSEIIHLFTQEPTDQSELLQHAIMIDDIFSKEQVEEIVAALKQFDNPFCNETLKTLDTKSPTSLKVTLRALQTGKLLEFDACMRQEFRLVNHFLQGHDFKEGIRALIIDKDQKPHWQPKTLTEITLADIENYFLPVHAELI